MATNHATDREPDAPLEEEAALVRPPAGWYRRAKGRLFSDGSLTKKASLNAVAQGLDYGARALAGLIVNPVLLAYLGPNGFGMFQVLERLISHAAPAGGRPAEALKWFIANRQASDDDEHKRQAVGSALAVWFVFLPILVPLGLVVGWFAPTWLHADPSLVWVVRIAAVALIADLIIAGITNIPWAAMAGQNVGYKRMGLTASLEFVAALFLIVGAVLHGGLVGVAIATALGTAVIGTVYYFLARIYVPWFGYSKPDRPAVKRFLALSWWFLLWNFVMKVTMGGDIIVLGIAGSTTEVTTYTLTRFIPVTVMAGVTSMIFGMAPGLGGLIGAGEVHRAARVRNETMAASWLLSTVACAAVLVWLPTFLGLWVGSRYYPGTVATLLIAVMIVQLTLIRVDSNIIDLTLNLRTKTLLGLLSAGLSVVIAWILVSTFDMGIPGVVVGFMLGRIPQSLAYPLMIGRFLSIPTSEQLRGTARAGLTTAGLFAVTSFLGTEVLLHSWIYLILGGGATAVVLGLAAFFLGLSARQRRWLKDRGRRIARLK
jgi:O-antigen/teichoic acid export membrane protein